LATEQIQTPKKHTIGAKFSLGSADHNNSLSSDKGVDDLYGYYNYAINHKVAIEVGFNEGSDGGLGFSISCCSNSVDLEYSNLVVAGVGSIQLSQRNSFFVKLGGQIYDYQITEYQLFTNTSQEHVDESGYGVFAEAGWQYRWDFGFGLDTGLRYIDMGDLSVLAFTAGVSYQF
jgi:hypothetical protein